MQNPHHINPFSSPAVLTPHQFHQRAGGVVGIGTVYEMLRAKRLRHVRIGKRYLILASELNDFFLREAQTPNHGAV